MIVLYLSTYYATDIYLQEDHATKPTNPSHMNSKYLYK